MVLLNEFNIRKIFIIVFYYTLISIKADSSGEFIDLKKLSHDSYYFVILDTGLYLYDSDLDDCTMISEFDNIEDISPNKTQLTELFTIQSAYIFFLVYEHLFIFNEYTYKLYNYTINKISEFIKDDYYYNIIPCKVEKYNASFIIWANNETNLLHFYFYNFNLNERINEPKEINYNNITIQNKMIRCQKNSSFYFINCFYYSNCNKFKFIQFTIDENNLNIYQNANEEIRNKNPVEIKHIEFVTSFNNIFFVCILNNSQNIGTGELVYFINDDFGKSNGINKKIQGSMDLKEQYKVFYFNETNQFMLIYKNDTLEGKIFNNSVNNSIIRNKNFFVKKNKEYSIIYNNSYQLIDYQNFSDCKKCYDLSSFKDDKQSEYLDKIKFYLYRANYEKIN